jgi:hypothetical protein
VADRGIFSEEFTFAAAAPVYPCVLFITAGLLPTSDQRRSGLRSNSETPTGRHPCPDHPPSTIGNMPHDGDRPELWPLLTDDELETIAPDYIWAAEMGDEAERLQFAARLDQLVAEAKRRGKPEIILEVARPALLTSSGAVTRVLGLETL